MLITDIIKKGENKTQEFKEVLPKNESIAKTIVAFSNTSGGKLIIGIKDNLEIVGIEEENLFQIQDKIASIVADLCYPMIVPEIYTLNIEGKIVLVIEVVKGNLKPYFLKNVGKAEGTYLRIGASNRKASFENIEELERQKRNISFDEDLYVSENVEYPELDYTPLVNQFKRIGKDLDQQKMLNLKLLTKRNQKFFPTNALMILLGKYPSSSIKCARFKGNTMEVFIDKKEYTGDLFTVLENAQNFILNHLHLGASIEGLYRKEKYELPEVALREALVNAVVHRDYTNSGRDIKVGVYDDIVNIVSPGALPNNMTIEDVYNGRSEVRNRVLANIFKELGLIEQWGSGIHRILASCEIYGLPSPSIQEKNDFVDVEIKRKPSDTTLIPSDIDKKPSDTTLIPSDIDKKPSDTKQEGIVLDYVSQNEFIKSKNVETLLGVKESRARELLKRMVLKGLIEKKGKARNSHYVISSSSPS